MKRRVYFAFNYTDVRDFRVNVVRNSGVVGDGDTFADASLWEKVKKSSDSMIKRMIDEGLERTTVTVVLIGSSTYNRRWVRYEIAKSFQRGNALIGVYIHNIKDRHKKTAVAGKNPFNYMGFATANGNVTLYEKERFLDLLWFQSAHISPVPVDKFRYKIPTSGEHKLSEFVPEYDWVSDNGFVNINAWIESAIQQQCKNRRGT